MEYGTEARIGHAGSYLLLHLLQQLAAGKQGGQPVVVAVIDYLEELLLGPGGGGMGPQVVQDEQGGLFHPFKGVVVAEFGLGAIRGTQVVQELGDGSEEDRLALGQPVVGDGCGQVGLAAAAEPQEDQPPLGLPGKFPGQA